MLCTARWRIPDFIRDLCSKLPAQRGPDLLCVLKRHLKQPAANSSFTLMAPFRSYTDLAPLPSQLHPPLSFTSSSVFASFIVVGFISHLAWRGNKRPTHWRNHVILFSHTLPFVFYFCLQRQTLSASRVRDKPSKVLCSEIIWQADKKKGCRERLWLLLLSSHLFLFPGGVRKLPVVQRFIRNHLSGYTFGKMSTPHLWHTQGCVRHQNGINVDAQLISKDLSCIPVLICNFY